MSRRDRERDLRYQPDERPPGGFVLGCGLQLVVLGVTGLVAFPTIVIRAAGESEAYLGWAVFCTVAVSGVATALQASRLGRIRAFIGEFAARSGWTRRWWIASTPPARRRC